MRKQDAGASPEFRIVETDECQKKIGLLASVDAQFIQRKLLDYVYLQLRKVPVFGLNIKKLKGYVPETCRYQIGRFRIFYLIDSTEKIVSILSVDHRRDPYK